MDQAIQQIETRLQRLENNPALNRNLDASSKDVMLQTVQENILDVVWDTYYYYSSNFESIAGYVVMGTTLSGDVDSDGIFVSTTAGTDYVLLSGATNNRIVADKELRFRVLALVDAVTDIDASILTMQTADGEIGFQFLNGSLRGFSSNVSGTTTITLSSYSASTYYKLEIRYIPGVCVKFLVDGVEKGQITTNLLNQTDTDLSMYVQTITVAGGSSRTIRAKYFEVIQKK